MKSEMFDKKFDENKTDITDDLELSSIRKLNQVQKRVNIDFPT